MSSLFFKLVAVSVRTIAKPTITWIVRNNTNVIKAGGKKESISHRFFVSVGQKYNYLNVKINRKIFSLPDFEPVKKLSKERALENGVEFVSEFLLYFVLLSLPFIEYYRTWLKNAEKEKEKKNEVKRLFKEIDILIEEYKNKESVIGELKGRANDLDGKLLVFEGNDT